MTIGFELEPKCATGETPQPSSEPPQAAKLARTVAATTPSFHERLALKRSSVAMMQPTRAARARIECGVRIAPSVKRLLFQPPPATATSSEAEVERARCNKMSFDDCTNMDFDEAQGQGGRRQRQSLAPHPRCASTNSISRMRNLPTPGD